MPTALDQQELLLNAWRTNNRVTIFLFENLPPELWAAAGRLVHVRSGLPPDVGGGYAAPERHAFHAWAMPLVWLLADRI